jgi:hypothetical protein
MDSEHESLVKLCGEPGKTTPLVDTGSGNTEVFIDDDHLLP